MNWNPFKRTSAVEMLAERVDLHHAFSTQNHKEVDSLRKVWADLLRSHRLLELRVKDLENYKNKFSDSKLQQKLKEEKQAHARTYAREYYYRKAANKPLMSETKLTKRFKKEKTNKAPIT